LLVALALALRLVDLGSRPFHHDESQAAYYAASYLRDHAYHYDPLLHGPWLYTLGAATFALAGVSDFAARLAPALMGTLVVALPFFARREFGRVAAFAAAAALAISPTMLYFSRFDREDIHLAALTLAVVVVAARFLADPRPWQPIVAGLLLAATLTVKESALFFGALGLLFIIAVLSSQRGRAPLVRAARALPAWSWLAAAAAFAVLYALLFSALGAHPEGIWDGIYEGPRYWLDQHGVGRGGEPWFYYVLLLTGYEWPLLALGAIGTVAVVRRPALITTFVVVWFVASLAFHTWAGEKFPWLVVHPLLPLTLLAGLGVQAIWVAPRARARVAGLALIAVGLPFLAFSSLRVNALHPSDPRELLVSTQTAPDAERARDVVLALDAQARAARGRPLSILVDSETTGGFPWAWYLRDLQLGFDRPGRQRPPAAPTFDVLILDDATRRALGPRLSGYAGRRIEFRVFRGGLHRITPRLLASWMVRREPLGPQGSSYAWLYVRGSS
jgi:uncharacterized protein (TIGR03663 family)